MSSAKWRLFGLGLNELKSLPYLLEANELNSWNIIFKFSLHFLSLL